jgi:hypothetical protein
MRSPNSDATNADSVVMEPMNLPGGAGRRPYQESSEPEDVGEQ